jgi:hypothetical protein
MFLTLLTKFTFSIIETVSFILLSFSLFRVPIKYAWKKVLIIAMLLSSISIYQREFLNAEEYALLTSILIYIVCIRFSFVISLWYSTLVCILGYISFALIQTLLLIIGSGIGWTSFDLLQTSVIHGSLLQLSSALVCGFIIYWMQSKKIGFMFVIKKYSLKESFKGNNFYIITIFILSVISLQLSFLSFREHSSMIYFAFTFILIFLIALIFTYKKNKKEITEKYGRTRNHDRDHS